MKTMEYSLKRSSNSFRDDACSGYIVHRTESHLETILPVSHSSSPYLSLRLSASDQTNGLQPATVPDGQLTETHKVVQLVSGPDVGVSH